MSLFDKDKKTADRAINQASGEKNDVKKTGEIPGITTLINNESEKPKNDMDAVAASEFYMALDIEFEKVLSAAIADGIIEGELTPDKIKRAGYVVHHEDGVGSYITYKGVRVSEIITP